MKTLIPLLGLAAVVPLAVTGLHAQSAPTHQASSAPNPLSVRLSESTGRDGLFDSGWRFYRGDAPDALSPGFDDSRWRTLDLPHDWSLEDLPPRAVTVPQLEAVTGEWRFQRGDDAAWSARDWDDAGWQTVRLPAAWEQHSQYTEDKVYGWYRRRLTVPAGDRGKDFDLLLGRIDDVDEVWLNGQRIGGTGKFPPNFQSAWDVERRYRVPAALVRGDGTDVLAVRVYDETYAGGIYAAGIEQVRIGPFAPGESENADRTGHVVGGTGWYRKRFTLNETGKRVAVRFDGVYMNSDVWINGHLLGNHPYGYTSFEYDLTPHLNPPGQANVLAVRVRNLGKNSRWYSGSGIYRHTWLTIREPVHVPTNGVFVTTPQIDKDQARVQVASEVRNDGPTDSDVRVRVVVGSGKVLQTTERTLRIPSGQTRSVTQDIVVRSPRLWSIGAPNLYRAVVQVVSQGKTLDTASTTFGIRKIEVDAVRGFRLNGVPLKLKGGCIHHDNGPLGAMALDRAEERKVELMKANGFNAIRSSHNPPSPALLATCDRLGMLVIDEAFDQWNEYKHDNTQDYNMYFKDWYTRDVASMVRRDRNHPSIIMWSIGNEIPEQFHAEATQKALRDAVLSHDATRLITQAISRGPDWDTTSDPAFTYLDVAGYNYLPDKYESDHARHPERVIVATETYPKDFYDYWSLVEKHPYVIGDFVWTAIDYLGESGLAHSTLSSEFDSFYMPWPWVNAWSGDLDICGFKKPQSLYRDVVWKRSPIEILVHTPIPAGQYERVSMWGWPSELPSWNWAGNEGTPLQVSVYTRCETVRLELNGKVIAEKPASDATKLTARFDVPYAPGTLRAVGLTGGKVVAQTTLKTSGAPSRIKLTADRSQIRADRNDLSYVTVEIVDQNGQRVSDAALPVRFSVVGAGELAAQGTGVPNEPASFRAPVCKTFQGRCLAILRPKGGAGDITLRVQGAGLAPAVLTIKAR